MFSSSSGPLSSQSSIELEKQLWVINVCMWVYTYCWNNNNNKKGARCSTRTHTRTHRGQGHSQRTSTINNFSLIDSTYTCTHVYFTYICIFIFHHLAIYFSLRYLPLRISIMKAQCVCVCAESVASSSATSHDIHRTRTLCLFRHLGARLSRCPTSAEAATHILLHTHTHTHTLCSSFGALSQRAAACYLSLILSIGGMQMRRMQYAKSECRWSAGLCQFPLPPSFHAILSLG